LVVFVVLVVEVVAVAPADAGAELVENGDWSGWEGDGVVVVLVGVSVVGPAFEAAT
jgi:hypothetical protein